MKNFETTATVLEAIDSANFLRETYQLIMPLAWAAH